MTAAASPDAFVSELSGWKSDLVIALRAAVHSAAAFNEIIKWGNLVFVHHGPCALIHVEDQRIVFGLWRGKRLTSIDSRVRPSGRYELGNIIFRRGDEIGSARVTRLAREGARLNAELGDPTVRA